MQGLVPVKGITSLVLREIVSSLIHGEVVAGVVAEEGSVGLTAVEDLAGLAPGEPPEEGIAGLLVGSNLTANSRSSVGGSRVDGTR